MSDKALILTWLVYAIIVYIGIVAFVLLVLYLLRKGKFKQWKQRRADKKKNKGSRSGTPPR